MRKLKTIQHKVASPLVSMGHIRLRQPLPSEEIINVDPFLLLHHYGPYAISQFNNPFDVGAVKIDYLNVTSPKGRTLELPLDLGGFGLSRYQLDFELINWEPQHLNQ